jgi:hypothetical protein
VMFVEEADIGLADVVKMAQAEAQEVIQAFAFDLADPGFREGVGLRRRLHPMVPIRRDFFRSRIPSIH